MALPRPPLVPSSARDERWRGGLSFDQYVLISAHLRFFGASQKAAVLSAHAITASFWEAARKEWSTAMKASIAHDRGRLLALWTAAFEPLWESLERHRPPIASIRPVVLDEASIDGSTRMALPAFASPEPRPDVEDLSTTVPRHDKLAKPLERTFSSAITTLRNGPPAVASKDLDSRLDSNASKPRRRSSRPPPRLAPEVEHYARVCAEVAAFPERAFEIWRNNGIADEASHRDLEMRWLEAFRADPALYRDFMLAYGRFFQELRKHR